jgi:hypothetical protein
MGAGASGLTLTAARHLVLLEPCLDLGLEAQVRQADRETLAKRPRGKKI